MRLLDISMRALDNSLAADITPSALATLRFQPSLVIAIGWNLHRGLKP